MPALTIHETTRLAELERTIGSGLATFVQVGLALLEVNNARLYRAEYRTFEAYCRERWGLDRQHAYRLMNAAEVAGSLPPQGQRPANELQTRALGSVPPGERAHVWEQATAGGARPTAARIRELAGQAPRDKPASGWSAACGGRNASSARPGASAMRPRGRSVTSGRACGSCAGWRKPEARLRTRPHGLRHAGITRLLHMGTDLRQVQRFSMHMTLQTILRYDDARTDAAGPVARRVAETV
jgi:hypothetical protein